MNSKEWITSACHLNLHPYRQGQPPKSHAPSSLMGVTSAAPTQRQELAIPIICIPPAHPHFNSQAAPVLAPLLGRRRCPHQRLSVRGRSLLLLRRPPPLMRLLRLLLLRVATLGRRPRQLGRQYPRLRVGFHREAAPWEPAVAR